MSGAGVHEARSILLIRLSSMGDILLLSPLLRQVRRRFPQAHISLVCGKTFLDTVRYHPAPDAVFAYDKSAGPQEHTALRRELAAVQEGRGFDVVLDLQNNKRSLRLSRGLGRRVLRVHKQRIAKLRMVYGPAGQDIRLAPVAERYLQTAASLGVRDDGEGLELWLPEEAGSPVYPPGAGGLAGNAAPRIALAPGAHHATKRWLPERFAAAGAELAQRFGAEIVLLGGPDDAALCASVGRAIPHGLAWRDYSGARSIFDTARVLDSCKLLIANDTGVAHIAAARRVPVVSIFGSTVPEFGFAPYRCPHVIAQSPQRCRPCTHIGRARCPKGHFACMREISVAMVVESAAGLLRAGPDSGTAFLP